ncbi:MAG TPA: DUF2336 domain-containing protein [Pseudolabrys sp.]|jgi:uncharacterized protein (DUF2336 family)
MHFSALIEELNEALAHGTAERRAAIVHRVTDIFVAGSATYSDNQIELFDDVFVRIVTAIELSARTVLAKRLANTPRAPFRISRHLASDDKIEVAGPVLEKSQALDSQTLVAAAQSKSQKHLLAISRRAELDEAVTDVLVERGDKPVVLSAAANPKARFSDKGYSTLVNRSEGDDEIATSVALRRDIPRQHLMRLLVKASHIVRVKLEAANPAMTEMIQSAVVDAADSILDRTGAVSREYVAARARFEALHAAGRLGESDIAALAAANNQEDTTAALAVLCDLPIEAVDLAMVQYRPETLLTMAKAIGLSWPTAKTILRMRAGARGISPGEIEQCFDTFARLKPATARQIIEFHRKRAHAPQPERRIA